MRTRTLATTLNGIVSLVLASSAAASCVGATASPVATSSTGVDDADGSVVDADAGLSEFACDAPLADYAPNLRPEDPVDHVELRTRSFPLDGTDAGDGGADMVTLDSESGSACANASDLGICLANLEVARRGQGKGWLTDRDGREWGGPVPFQFLVFTRGDAVGVIDSPEALVSFLGRIDTLEEARLVLSSVSFALRCRTTPFKTGWKRNGDGSWEMVTDGSNCGNTTRLWMKISPEGVVTEAKRDEITTGLVCGRRPEGLAATGAGGAEVSLGAWLAEAAHLEAASVVAFRRLERELRSLGAPAELITRARRSRADEIHHAREMASLARRHGSEPAPVVVATEAIRTAFAIALENAVEGCVRETFGALVASYQARRASDPELRAVLERVARDEARHAALAHDVASWLEPRLDADERASIASAREAALAELRTSATRPPAADVARLAGMPSPGETRALLDLLDTQVLRQVA